MSSMPKPVRRPPTPADLSADIRVLAAKVFGTDRGADAWMDRPNPELGGKTPRKLVESGRAEVVRDFLAATREGDFG